MCASQSRIPIETIRHFSDIQPNLSSIPRVIKRDRYKAESTASLSIHGDAPKCFLLLREHRDDRPRQTRERWIQYIAKVGIKWYPLESITEHLLTRIGEVFGFDVAQSKLRIVGEQLRFLSCYFLKPAELLTHGIEVFQHHLDVDFVQRIAAARVEQDFYTYKTVCAAMRDRFPDDYDRIMPRLIEMLAFDAIIGHNDRHPANWGVITPIAKAGRPRFSPIFDTARALYWNVAERKMSRFLTDPQVFDGYIRRSKPQIGWDGVDSIGHFDLIREICVHVDTCGPIFGKFRSTELVDSCVAMMDAEFSELLSAERRQLIARTLRRRHELFLEATS